MWSNHLRSCETFFYFRGSIGTAEQKPLPLRKHERLDEAGISLHRALVPGTNRALDQVVPVPYAPMVLHDLLVASIARTLVYLRPVYDEC